LQVQKTGRAKSAKKYEGGNIFSFVPFAAFVRPLRARIDLVGFGG